MLVRPDISDYLAPLRRYGGVLGHVFTFDSRAPLVNAFIWSESYIA